MFNRLLLALAACSSLSYAAPFPHESTEITGALTRTIVPRAANGSFCPGYTASNVETTDSTLTADLSLAGNACNIYSDDITDLKLLVEYQTSKSHGGCH